MSGPRQLVAERHAEVLLSDKVLGSVVTAWKVGKEALALLVVGTIAILAAFSLAMSGRNDYLAAGFLLAGSAVVSFIVYKVYVDALKPAARASQQIEQSSELMNAVQEAALQLTTIISQLNDYALLHAEEIVSAIDQARAILALMPGGGRVLNLDSFKRPEEFARSIRAVAARSRDLVTDVRDSVAKSDATRIMAHLEDLKRLKELIEGELLR